jgi:hypothetical protein
MGFKSRAQFSEGDRISRTVGPEANPGLRFTFLRGQRETRGRLPEHS